MKEFIEKLIGRLEEYKYSHLVEHDKERLEHCTENERLTLKSVNGDVWLLDSEGKPYLLSVDGDDYNNALNRLADFEAIGTIEDFKALKEKNVAKKPHSISIANDIGNSMVECPICHARSDYDVKSIKRGHCWKCGQKLDWSE